MIAGAAAFADAAAAHTVDNLLVGYFQRHHSVESDSRLLQCLCLSDRAGHAVQNVAARAVRLLQTLVDDADDDLIRHQLAGIHVLLGLQAGGSSIFDGGTQDVARGDRGDPQRFLDNICLCALTGTRSA